MLDIYAPSNLDKSKGLRPVLVSDEIEGLVSLQLFLQVHIHGGSWRTGSKNFFYPHEKLLVTEENWVNFDHSSNW